MNDLKEVLEARNRAEKEERIRNILSASKKLFLKKGYFSTTMRDICREAALSIGAVYFYFSGKEEIYARVCEECFLFLLALFEKAIDKKAPALQQLENARKAYLDFYTRHNDQWVLLRSGFRNAISSPELLNKLEAVDSRLLAMFREMVSHILEENNLAEKHDATETTFALWAGVEGLLTLHNHKYLAKQGLNLERLADKQFRVFLKGLFEKEV
jgi:AcrR family transcriptional regulator